MLLGHLLFTLFIGLLLAAWVGATIFGLYPFPFIIAGLALALAFAVLAAEGRRHPSAIQGPRELPRIAASDSGPLAMVLWLLVVMLIGAIAFRYLTS